MKAFSIILSLALALPIASQQIYDVVSVPLVPLRYCMLTILHAMGMLVVDDMATRQCLHVQELRAKPYQLRFSRFDWRI